MRPAVPAQHNAVIRSLKLFFSLAFVLLFSACGPSHDELEIENLIPQVPANTNFGGLYPRLNSMLDEQEHDIRSAIETTRAWASERLGEFTEGACAHAQVVYDGEFASAFGRNTLGVTLPWMQIYIRDGRRGDIYIWKDATLFVSTVLHEYMHAMQRARQANRYYEFGAQGESLCQTARGTLTSKRGTWNMGFAELRERGRLSPGVYTDSERALLHEWISPITRARDEVEASLYTIRWMSQYPDELNMMTVGGANNWAYGVQYLEQLRVLATSNCFSPDADTYAEELRVYEEEIPRYVAELSEYENSIRYFLNQHGLPVVEYQLADMAVPANPRGRVGHACNTSAMLRLPRYPLKDGGHLTIRPIPLD